MGELCLTVASWDDREDLVIELTVEDDTGIEEWGLVTYDQVSGRAVLDLYPRDNNDEWHFDLDEVTAILARAQKRIMEVAGPLDPETPESKGTEADAAVQLATPAAVR